MMSSASPISVCMFSNLYPPVVSGSSTQTASLARELARRGCPAVVITAKVSGESKDYEVVDGVHVYRLPAVRLPRMTVSLNFPWLNYTFTRKNLRRVAEILERHRPDVLHLHNHMFDLALTASLVRRRTGLPLVLTIHTVIKHARAAYNLLLYPADRVMLKRLVVGQADALICPDLNVREYVREAFGRTDTSLVPYGISLPGSPVNGAVERLRAKYGLDGKRVILSLGHVHAIRNRKDLVEAMPGVLEKFPEAVLLIVGAVADGSPAAAAKRLDVDGSVVFTGHVPHAEVPAFLALADVEAHWLNQDTPDKTSLGIASLEAMGAGKVVLAAANENTYGPGVLKSGDNLILVEPGKPEKLARTIADLFGDHERRAAIGQRASQTVRENFSWEIIGDRTLGVYEEAIRRRAS